MNEQVKKNIDWFPEGFRFQLSEIEANSLWSQIVTLEKGKGKHKQTIAIRKESLRKVQLFGFSEQFDKKG